MLRAAPRLVKPSSMRGALILLLLAVTATAAAAPRAARKKPPEPADKTAKASEKDAKVSEKPAEPRPPRAPGPDDAKAMAILGRIVAGPDATARKAAIAELAEIAPSTIEAIG